MLSKKPDIEDSVHTSLITEDSSSSPAAPRKNRVKRVAKWIGIVVAVLIALPMLLLCLLSLWLTPDRLTAIVNREGSKYLMADIQAKDVDYSLWSTFPRFKVTTGEVDLISRTLDGVSPEIQRQLPDSAKFLASIKSFSGEINVVDLFMNRYVIHEVNVEGLQLNFVAYNDSINNYNIIPSTGKGFKKVPYISAESIRLAEAGTIKYTSVTSNTNASLHLKNLDLIRRRGKDVKKNTYRLELQGTVTATSSGLRILNKFPFMLGGDLNLRFNPFGVSLSDYRIDLGELSSKLSMSVGVGDDPKVDSFDYQISNISLAGLMSYLPKELVPSLQGLEADIQVNASAKLLSSWSFSSEDFPSIEVDFNIPSGNLNYTVTLPAKKGVPTREATYSLSHTPVEASFIFNGKNPDASYLNIKDFEVATDGLALRLGVMISRMTSHPLVSANLDVDADVARSLRLLPFTSPVEASGKMTMSSNLAFSVRDFTKEGLTKGLEDIAVDADIKASGIALKGRSLGIRGSAGDINLRIVQKAERLDSAGVMNPAVTVKGSVASANLKMDKGVTVKAGSLQFSTSSNFSGLLTTAVLNAGLPVAVSGELHNIKCLVPASEMEVNIPRLAFSDQLSKHTGKTAYDLLSDGVKIEVPRADFTSGHNHFNIHNLSLDASLAMAGPSGIVVRKPAEKVSPEGTELPHTPELIQFSAPEGLRSFLADYSLRSRLRIGKIDIITPGFRHDNYLANIDLTVNDRNVRLDNIDIMLKKTRARMSADIGNIRSFLLNPASEKNPLQADLNLMLDTVNINALAKAYVESKGGMQNIPRHDKLTASDSVALMVPRNINVRVALAANELIYTNLFFTDVKADIGVSEGRLRIPDLSLASSFGAADLNVVYDSRDIQDLSLRLGLDINQIDIIKFFKKFPSLIRMIPEMRNLSGTISAGVTFSTDIFPDMYINMPSVTADLLVEGRGLTVKQSRFIRRITKMMLIESGDPIHIHNMDVRAKIHDNLLQLYPFNFEFDRYKLKMLGVNNFNGELYYHIAVDKSPVPFPFSVNIEGQFHHPKLRFGGGKFDSEHADRITSQIQEENNINMVLILRKLLRAFVGEAVKKDWNKEED